MPKPRYRHEYYNQMWWILFTNDLGHEHWKQLNFTPAFFNSHNIKELDERWIDNQIFKDT